jgi:hypothetical protein
MPRSAQCCTSRLTLHWTARHRRPWGPRAMRGAPPAMRHGTHAVRHVPATRGTRLLSLATCRTAAPRADPSEAYRPLPLSFPKNVLGARPSSVGNRGARVSA